LKITTLAAHHPTEDQREQQIENNGKQDGATRHDTFVDQSQHGGGSRQLASFPARRAEIDRELAQATHAITIGHLQVRWNRSPDRCELQFAQDSHPL
jgi:hypothetical protein